jgi:hypothetical protein
MPAGAFGGDSQYDFTVTEILKGNREIEGTIATQF